jgi:deoxycytidylate deaminase
MRSEKYFHVIETLIKAANSSDLVQKHGAGLIKGDKLYSRGFNYALKRYNIGEKLVKITVHAEMDALLNAPLNTLKGLDIMVIRVNKNMALKNSRPCNACISKMQEKGIRKVYYSNDLGDIVYEFLDDMQLKHTSSGHLHRSKHLIQNAL